MVDLVLNLHKFLKYFQLTDQFKYHLVDCYVIFYGQIQQNNFKDGLILKGELVINSELMLLEIF
jgi:hypothetical protein